MTSAAELEALRRLAERTHCRVEAEVPDAWLDKDLVSGLPVDFLRNGPLLPVRDGDQCVVCTPDPAIDTRFPELSVWLKGDVEPVLVPADAVLDAIDRCLSRGHSEPPETEQPEPAAGPIPDDGREDLLRQSDAAPVTSRVNQILLDGLEQGASDIHVEPTGVRMRVRFRLDGVLLRQAELPAGMEDAVVSRVKIMAGLDVAERRLPQDGNARVRVGGREVDVRVSTLPVADGERIVLRLLGRESTRFSLKDLGMPQGVRDDFGSLLEHPHGVIWVTGPTGSGKTTTLYAALQTLDTARQNILTIEDPVEYQLPDIGQMAVRPRIDLTFARGLRALLRQDPDVILVGETRDEETAEIVVRASMTGHLVLSTLHANDAVSAALRLTDMGVDAFRVAEATRGALAQRLVRRLCPHCSVETDASGLAVELGLSLQGPVREAVGCDRCREGYRGRRGLFELLVVDSGLRQLIREDAGAETLRAATREREIADLWSAAEEALRSGETSVAEVGRVLGHRE